MTKKLTSLVLALVMCLSLCVPAFAESNESHNLSNIADQIIRCNTYLDASGAYVSEYSNLNEFVDEIHLNYPAISDYDISVFLCQYTGQDYEALPDEKIDSILQYSILTTTAQYIGIKEDGTTFISDSEVMPVDSWNSSDGYMNIITSYGLTNTINGEKYYDVWATAAWLKYPNMYGLGDSFVIGTNGTFNSSITESGRVVQRFTCQSCGRQTNHIREVSRYSQTDGDLTLEYAGYVPVLRFDGILPECAYCDGPVTQTQYSAYISYGVITAGSKNIQASYAHTTVGFTGFSVSISGTGAPSFSAGLGTTLTKYPGRSVTLS